MDELKNLTRRILKDIKVELQDEFTKNFERQGFFSEKWKPRKGPLRPGGSILIKTGDLRKSIGSRVDGDNSITFFSYQPYAAIHNEGGEIKVTAKMKRFFWAKYKEATGSFGYTKGGRRRNNQKNRRLSSEAEYWRALALKREGSTLKIPRRQFLGMAPEVEATVRKIIEDALEEYFGKEMKI